MAAVVAGNAIAGPSLIRGWGSVAVSYPEFAHDFDQLTVPK
jgi:5-enolpyruvylshikimate-3-phosphate synthase